MLRRTLRAVVAILAFLPLQFFGAGFAVAGVLGGDGVSSAMGMPGMAPSSAVTIASPETAAEDGAPAHVCSADTVCDHGEAPSPCMTAPACAAFVFALPRGEREVALVAHPDGLGPMTVLAPASVTQPPDLRPPRA